MPTLTRNAPPRRLTDAERRAVLTSRLLAGELTPCEWSEKMDQLDRRYNVLGWTVVAATLAGLTLAAAAIVGLAWLAIVAIVGLVSGTP